MKEAFLEGGWPMVPTLAFGLLLLAGALRFARSPERRSAALLGCLTMLVLASGGLGFVSGVIKTAHAAEASSSPWHIAFLGIGESLHNVALALICVVLASLVACVGAMRGMGGSPAQGRQQASTTAG